MIYTVTIEGMICSMCQAHISDVIRRTVPGAKKVSSSHTKGEPGFLSAEAANESRPKEAAAATGYTRMGVESARCGKKGLFGWK